MSSTGSKLIRIANVVSTLERRAGDEPEEEEAKGDSKRPGGKYIEFMKEMGSKKVRNPDTGNTVMIKSLKSDKGKKVVEKEFQRWLKRQDKKQKAPDKSKLTPEMQKALERATRRS